MANDVVTADFVMDNMSAMHVIDVRPTEYYKQGHIPHAVSIPMRITDQDPEEPANFFVHRVEEIGINRNDNIIVYCTKGKLARDASNILESHGFTNVHYYEGSWEDWVSDASRPTEL